MAALTIQSPVRAGLAPAYVAAAADQTVPNNGRTILHVKNTNAATRTLTITSYAVAPAEGGLVQTNLAVVIPALTGDLMIGPFPKDQWNNPANGSLTLAWSATADVTIAAVSVPAV